MKFYNKILIVTTMSILFLKAHYVMFGKPQFYFFLKKSKNAEVRKQNKCVFVIHIQTAVAFPLDATAISY